MASKYIAPPLLVPEKYEQWKKEMSLWEMATNVDAKKRAPTVFLTLPEKAKEAVLELDAATLNENDGMEKLYEKLDLLYKEDSNQSAFLAYETFEQYEKAESTSVTDYLIEFDRLVAKLKTHKITLPEPVLAYRALKSANLKPEDEKLVKATVSDLTLKEMGNQLKKVMKGYNNDTSENKQTPTVVKKEVNVDFTEVENIQENLENSDGSQEVLYGRWSYRRPYQHSNRRGRFSRSRGGRTNRNWSSTSKKVNPSGPDGKPTRCHICNCTYHWARNCPYDSSSKGNQNEQSETDDQDVHIVLMNKQVKENDGHTFLGETIGNMILDCGASGTVCGKKWYECFLDTLSETLREDIKVEKGKRYFRFGNGERLKSLFNVVLPCNIAGLRVNIITDVVESDIPLLLSKASMKRAKTRLHFDTDTVTILGKTLKLKCTSSGHYFIPITRPLIEKGGDHITLFVRNIESKSTQEKVKIATKLHRQFSHPSGKKLSDLAKDAGIKDAEFLCLLKEFPKTCEFCLRYKKSEPRPIVGFSLGSYFNETVSMDIKEINGIKVLHMIDHGTRYSVAVRIKSKEASEIIDVIFKYWIAYFGTPTSFLTDNGREFNNSLFRDMAQNLNIIVRTTAAQSPWSNGLNERHNGLLGESVKKTLEDVKCDFDIALAMAVSAKNTLHNFNGYSPNQLVFGRNPNYPSFLNDQLPALEGVSTSEMIASIINAKHAAWRAHIENESSEKLRRAVRHQVRTSASQIYNNGDLVLFKRNEADRWLGPGTVIGWENKQVLVKHGGTYVRVNPSRLTLYPGAHEVSNEGKQIDEIDGNVGREGVIEEPELSLPQQDINDWGIEPEVEPEENREVTTDQRMSESIVSDNKQTHSGRPSKQKLDVKAITLPKPGQIIKCKLAHDDENDWRDMKVINRAGKATGRNKYLMNVILEDGEPFWLDFQNGVCEWKIMDVESNQETDGDYVVEDENVAEDENTSYEDVMIASSNHEMELAKKRELQSWVDNKVYTQVLDRGQSKISTRWICTTKVKNDNMIYKARLVAKGFQDADAGNIRNDSPTCSKEGLRLVLGIIASHGWTAKSLDIKTAFLQSQQIDRLVYLVPPPEANVPPGYIWKLSKCVYGLTDASRSWYLTLKSVLLQLGAVPSKLDEAIFTWYCGNKLHGIIATHVDDLCFAGSKMFYTSIIDKITKVFKINTEEVADFKYIGLEVKKCGDTIKLGQDEYVKKIKTASVNGRNPDVKISDEEVSELRKIIGQLNWLATQTRPDLSYDISDLSSTLKNKNVDCIKQVNKTVKKAKKEKSQIVIPDLGTTTNLKLIGYSDASFANLGDGGSQGGYVIFLVGDNNKYMPISWQSKRISRIVKSTLAAETLAMVDLAEACVYYRKLILDLLHIGDKKDNIPIVCKTDNSSLFDSVHSTTQILDKRLRIEMAILREMLNKKELEEIVWVPKDNQIADSLTKKGVPSFKILGYISEPKESSV